MAKPTPLPKEIQARADKARYRLTDKAYINDTYYDPEKMPYDPDAPADEPRRKPLIIPYNGIPGPHMEPANEDAQFMCDKFPQFRQSVDPIQELTIIGDGK